VTGRCLGITPVMDSIWQACVARRVATTFLHLTHYEECIVTTTEKKDEQGQQSGDGPTGEQTQPQEAQQRPRVEVDDSNAATMYANFCRVTGTPEELIIDFGLNSQPMGVPNEPVMVKQRIVTNYYTAKRMLHALHLSVQRHEQAFGVLETDVQKRVIGKPGRS